MVNKGGAQGGPHRRAKAQTNGAVVAFTPKGKGPIKRTPLLVAKATLQDDIYEPEKVIAEATKNSTKKFELE